MNFVYKIVNRKTGKIPFNSRGFESLKTAINTINYRMRWHKDRLHKGDYDLVQFELKEKVKLPITKNTDFNDLMFSIFEETNESLQPKK